MSFKRFYCTRCDITFEGRTADDPASMYYEGICPNCNSSFDVKEIS